jgi:PKHD-type hydroxylase
MEWLYDKIWHWTNVANDDLWNFSLGGFKDTAQYGEYEAPDGKYDYHMDIMGDTINHRKVSFICSLNNGYTGGHLEFLHGRDPVEIKLGPGDAVLFPSFYLHRVTPVLTGKRESIVQWVSGDPYR